MFLIFYLQVKVVTNPHRVTTIFFSLYIKLVLSIVDRIIFLRLILQIYLDFLEIVCALKSDPYFMCISMEHHPMELQV